jgi:hypothetical protein
MAATLLAAGCGSGPRVGPPEPASTGPAGTFSSIEQNILVPRCASAACHSGNPPPSAPLSLDLEVAYANIVSQPSQQLPGMNQVEPGRPDQSYLLLKMRGTAGSVGGVATPMPINDQSLDDADLAAVESWILDGAPND